MSRLIHFPSWEVSEKRKLISQLIIDAVTNNDISLAYALLGPRISKAEEETLASYQREINENEKRMYPEEIRQRLFTAQLKAIEDHYISTRYQDITVQGYTAAVEEVSTSCRSELILAYRDRLKARLDISSAEVSERSELRAYIAVLDTIFKDNSFELERLDYLSALKASIEEKLALSEKRHDMLAGQENMGLAMRLETLQLDFDERRELHQSAIDLAYGAPERSQWKLHDPTLKDMTFEEFKVLANYNVDQKDPDQRVTVDNCLTIEGYSVLHIAFFNYYEEMARFLIEGYGADITQKNLQGQTPQQFAGMSREHPFLQLVFSKDGKRPLSNFLQRVQEHLEGYKRNVLDANFLYRLCHHLFINVRQKHERRVNEHRELQQALEQARESYHDDDVATLALRLIATSPRREGALLGGLQELILAREANRLASPHRVLQRIDSATAVQNTDLLDAYQKKIVENEEIIVQKDAVVLTLAQERADRAEEQADTARMKQCYEMSLKTKDETITSLNAHIAKQDARIADQDAVIAGQNTRLAKLEGLVAQLLQNQEEREEGRRRSPSPRVFS